ncbi:MAG TPA: PQQ-dependent sugar dehydrogenase, partial [Blastocatellia bacterium]|nr:PQQ-dependent sugar dehydrogenase [Blastocatellia bacterium]
MLRSKSLFTLGVIVTSTLLLSSVSFPGRSLAQVRQPTVARGFEMNLFADPTNVPEFATSAYAGPTAMAFDSRGRLFVGTLSGKILILLDNNDDGRMDQVKTFATGVPQPLGLEFRPNGDLYATSNIVNGAGRIVRLRDLDGDDLADEQTVIVDNLPSQGDHQTDRLKFGPDGMLYFGQGSSTDNGTPIAGRPPEAPLNATILRIDVDNPTINIVATGLRNPFGMAFHPENGALFATDGGSGEVCQSANCGEDLAPPEEVNWIVSGGNYGFPQCEGTPTADRPGCLGVRSPSIQYPRHLTPTSLAFYTGPQAGEFKNQLLLTLYKNLPNQENYGGDLRRLIVEGDAATGFRLRDAGPDEFIVRFDPIDPFDGPVETAIDPISGDIYVARIDPVTHADLHEHHHFIYRIHREGSDAKPFIGPARPAAVKAGSAALTISVTGRHLRPGAVVFNLSDNVPLVTRQGASIFELVADLPAGAIASERTITLEARNPDGAVSNQQFFSVTKTDVDPPPSDKAPRLASLFVYKKKRSKVVDPLTAGATPKKLRLVVTGADFDAGAKLFVNDAALELQSASATELVAFVTKGMVAAPGELTVQVRNSTGKVSNTLKLVVAP